MRDEVDCPHLGPIPKEVCEARRAKGFPVCRECKTVQEGGVNKTQEEMVRKGDEDKKRRKMCKYPGCDKTVWRKGYCKRHLKEEMPEVYEQYMKGRPNETPSPTPKSEECEDIPIQVVFPKNEYDRLREVAEVELRPIEYQVRYFVKKALEEA